MRDEFDLARREVDPLRQAQKATKLLTLYQQRSVELARLRKEAIGRAVKETGMTYAAVAQAVGLSKGRITQIRQTAPPPHRALFGIGPVSLLIPARSLPSRSTSVVALEDTEAAEGMRTLLTSLHFHVHQAPLLPSTDLPPGDVVAICGPKSSAAVARIIAADPVMDFGQRSNGRWTIRHRTTGAELVSPLDDAEADSDHAYVSRVTQADRTLVVVAGIHALGSIGAVEYLTRYAPALYNATDGGDFSLAISSTFNGLTTSTTEAAWPVDVHQNEAS